MSDLIQKLKVKYSEMKPINFIFKDRPHVCLYKNIHDVQQFGVTHFCLELSDKVSQAEIVRALKKRKSNKAGAK